MERGKTLTEKICEFFGPENQLEKAWEEFNEIGVAIYNYEQYTSTGNIVHLLEEINDLKNVVEGIAKSVHKVNLEDTETKKQDKIDRTNAIIDQIDKKLSYNDMVKAYDEIRRK